MCFFLARSSAEKNAADIKVRLDGFSGRSSRKGKTLLFYLKNVGLRWKIDLMLLMGFLLVLLLISKSLILFFFMLLSLLLLLLLSM